MYRRDVDPIRHDRAYGVHEIRLDMSESSSREEPKQNELQRKWPPRDPSLHPAFHERPEFGREIGRDNDEIYFAAASADKLGACTLHPSAVVNVVRNEYDNREKLR